MTKAQLEAALAASQEETRALHEASQHRIAVLEDAAHHLALDRDAHKAGYEAAKLREKELGVTVYTAARSLGKPVCAYATGTEPDSDYAVAMYLDSGRNMVGVVVTGPDGEDVCGAGLVPFDRDATI